MRLIAFVPLALPVDELEGGFSGRAVARHLAVTTFLLARPSATTAADCALSMVAAAGDGGSAAAACVVSVLPGPCVASVLLPAAAPGSARSETPASSNVAIARGSLVATMPTA